MLTSTEKTNILLWTDQFFAESVVCLNEYICCGKSPCGLCAKITKVYSLKHAIESAGTYITETQIDNLYRRLQCLINLRIQD